MRGRVLQARPGDACQPDDTGPARRPEQAATDSPGIGLLDALRAGDDHGVLAACGDTTTVSAENLSWSCTGRDRILTMLMEARDRFPGLTFESRTRHVGFGLVIDEARVRDQTGDAQTARLDMPVRVTVRHDDLQVHEVTLSFPAALLKRALGIRVDPLEVSLSEVQSAFFSPVGEGLTTYSLAHPDLALVPPAAVEETAPGAEAEQPKRRRRRVLVSLAVVLVAALTVGGWWVVQGRGGAAVAGPARSTAPQPSASASVASPTPSASSSPSSSAAPTVTQGKASSGTPSRKPNVTLRSDLAFGFNSAGLSSQAKAAINNVAHQVRQARLSGKIYVDGYTDDLGSAAYGQVLSQRRADAVSAYLQSQLIGVPVSIVSVGHGESDPVADNSTAAGRRANRRVTITLPNS